MKHLLLSSSLFVSLFYTSVAHGQHVKPCLSHEAIDYCESKTPGYKQVVEQQFQQAKNWNSGLIQKVGELYTIPVVVHIVYNTPNQNLADSVILDQIQALNDDYNRMNADTANLRSDFFPIAGNPRIKFVLAGIDPSGNPTTGITRTQTNTQTFGDLLALAGNFTELEKVKSTANGGIDPWDQTRYLNIWVCNMSVVFFGQETTALLGYATPPANLPNWPAGSNPGLSDGVVIQYQCFGRNNPNPLMVNNAPQEVLGRTVTHEVGHYLGLRHIWGDGDCTQQDGIDDTPNADAQSDFDCDVNKNTCVDAIASLGDLPDMIENYMDYSAESCQNSFTAGQVALIHGVLENQRYDLTHGNPASIDIINKEALKIYPNPTNDFVKITVEETVEIIEVFDIHGTLLKTIYPSHHQLQLDMTSFDAGVYMLIPRNGEHVFQAQRIIKL